jgi:hypothetical protein
MDILIERERVEAGLENAAKKTLPCPFCGTDPYLMKSGEGSRGLMIHCIAENCPNPSTSYYEHDVALRVWNQRNGITKD